MGNVPTKGLPGNGPDGMKILERIGIGRRSIWYRARQVRLDRDVALKRLRPVLAENPVFQRLFLEAGRQAATIVHPAALPIINVYPNQFCIAVHWCEGRALEERTGEFDVLRAVGVGRVVMDCLASLHATNRCHGNLSPGNIFVGESGGVWLTDFFQPPVMCDGDTIFQGTQRYIAPEVLRGAEVDWRSDVFSLGCILHDLVASSPTGCSRDFLRLIESMKALDPFRRGETPRAVFEALVKMKKIEENRTGKNSDSVRRRRMYRRVPAEFTVSMRRRSATPGETVVILKKIRDIGESGVFVETDDELLGVGSIIEMDFALKGVDENVHAFGVVRWKSEAPMPRGVGVQFMEVDQEGLTRLRRFLDSRQGQKK